MLHGQLIQCAKEEIERKSFGVVEQFLKIHEIVYVSNEPKIDRIDTEKQDGTAIAYFPVKNEKFHLAIYMSTTPNVAVTGVWVESGNEVYFVAYSEIYDCQELSSMTLLSATEVRNKGEKKNSGKAVYKESSIYFEPNPEPDEFEDKLRKLLDFLEQDKAGVKNLIDNANGHILARMIFHNGNTILGGPDIDRKNVRRLAALNLEIRFDLYAEGESWT